MEKVDLVIKNGKVVTPTGVVSAGIAIDKEKIVAIAKETSLPPASKTIDASGKYVLPGLIDPHVHFGYTGKIGEQIQGDSEAAAAGGVTTFGHYIRAYTQSPLELLENDRKALEEHSVVDGFFHTMMVAEYLDTIPQLPQKGINSFKFLMGYKGPQAAARGIVPIDDGVLFDGFERMSKLGRPVWGMVHAENIDISLVIRKRLEKAGRRDFPAWNETRPRFVEAEAIQRAIFIAKVTNCPLYIVHNTVAEAVDMISKAKAEGINVVGETCPQYLTHSSEEPWPILTKHPTLGNVNPPLRDKESNERLWQGIRDGWIETIGSDHAPATLEQKGDDIWKAVMGVGNITEVILPVMLSEGVNKGRISLEKLVEVCCYNPARIFGLLPRKGNISIGADADLVIVDLEKKVKLTKNMLHCPHCDWTIYEGWEFKGWPILTLLRGNIIMQEGKIVGKPGVGRYLYCRCE